MPASRSIVLFDGLCNFCNGTINFLIRQDKAGVFRFAPLQSEAGQRLLSQHGLPKKDFNSFVLLKMGRLILGQRLAYGYTKNFLGIGNGHNCFGSFQNRRGMLCMISLPKTDINGLGKKMLA
jgi:hypothetical protein